MKIIVRLGERKWCILTNSEDYFSYLEVDGQTHFIKDMHNREVISKVLLMKIGDRFKIIGLGLLEIVNIHYQPHKDVDYIIKEVGFTCRRLDA